MDYFFKCQKNIFNLENNKCIRQEIFFVYTSLDLLTPDLFFELCISQLYIQNFERNWKNSICIKICKFLNFTGVFTKKKIEIIKI